MCEPKNESRRRNKIVIPIAVKKKKSNKKYFESRVIGNLKFKLKNKHSIYDIENCFI